MTETVKSLPHTYVAQDLSLVEMTFEFESGTGQTLRFPIGLFDKFMSRAAQLVATARSHTLAKGDHLAVHAVQVVDVTAQAPVGGGKVILSLLGDNGMPTAWALHPGHADRLRGELYRAIRAARKQASQPRH